MDTKGVSHNDESPLSTNTTVPGTPPLSASDPFRILNPPTSIQQDGGSDGDSSEFQSAPRPQLKPIGASGTELYAGYFSEEFLVKLRGRAAQKIWDEMRRSEPQVAMLLNATTGPIKSGTWDVEAADATIVPDAELHQRFIEYNLFQCIDWETFLTEALTFVFGGFSMFERIDGVIPEHPEFKGLIGLRALAFRSQKTIERWIVDHTTGSLQSVIQWVRGDIALGRSAMLEMDAKYLLLFTLQKEGDNYEGISALRAMYGPYFRKNLYLKLAAIGLEKSAIGTPIGTTPANAAKTEQFNQFKEMLANFVAHEDAFLIMPEGYKIEMANVTFNAQAVKDMILLENTEMINALVANFLALATHGGSGSYALGSSLSDFFLMIIKNLANIMCGVVNRKLIPDLIKMNYGPQLSYPKLTVTDIDNKAGKDLAEIVKGLTDSKSVIPDDKLEDHLRKRFGLPAADKLTQRKVDPPKDLLGGNNLGLSERHFKLAESWKVQWKNKRDDLKAIMQKGLREILDSYESQIRSQWKKATPAMRQQIALKLEPKGVVDYRNALKECLAEIATDALAGAKKETPKAKNVKLHEFKLAENSSFFDALPPNIRRIVATQAALISDSQAQDINKTVTFQFASSSVSDEDVDQVLTDIENTIGPTIEDGATGKGMSIDAAAGNAVSQVANQTRMEWFFEPDVLDTIESFTFTNEDPVSEICQELDGTTWAANDPDLDRYAPPLHHNCKSRIVPNEKGDSRNPEIDGTGSISQKGLDSITLCECAYHLEFKLAESKDNVPSLTELVLANLSKEDQAKISDKIAVLVGEGKDQEQAAAVAYSMLSRGEL